MKIFITGLPRCGKTTLIKKVIEKEKNYLAIVSEEIRENHKRIGFELKLIEDGNILIKKILALNKNINRGKKFGKYFIFIDNINEIVDKATKISKEKKIIFIDEIGKMEFYSEKFKNFINELLASDKKIIATLHRDFIKEFEKYGKIFWLTKENFEDIFSIILKNIKN